jgi:hypothetical protein
MGRGSDQKLRFSDWCLVTTEIGSMLETYNFNRGASINSDFDWSEAANRIDATASYDPNCQIWNERTTGGPLGMPIAGY